MLTYTPRHGLGAVAEAALFAQAQAGCATSPGLTASLSWTTVQGTGLNELMARHDRLVHAVVRRQVLPVLSDRQGATCPLPRRWRQDGSVSGTPSWATTPDAALLSLAFRQDRFYLRLALHHAPGVAGGQGPCPGTERAPSGGPLLTKPRPGIASIIEPAMLSRGATPLFRVGVSNVCPSMVCHAARLPVPVRHRTGWTSWPTSGSI
jgi:hypothetical protein